MNKHVLEWKRQFRGANFGDTGGKRIILGGVRGDGFDRLVLRGGESEEVGCNPVEVTHINTFKFLIPISKLAAVEINVNQRNILFKVKVTQTTKTLLLGLPHSIDYILDVQDKISLAVSSVAERHVWWVSLRNRRKGQMRRPRLNQNHVACNKASSVRTATGICLAVENHRSVAVGRVPEDFVEENCKSVQVTDVKRTKVRVESIVKEGVVDGKVHGRSALASRRGRLLRTRPLAWGLGLVERVREWCARAWGRVIGSQVQPVYNCLFCC